MVNARHDQPIMLPEFRKLRDAVLSKHGEAIRNGFFWRHELKTRLRQDQLPGGFYEWHVQIDLSELPLDVGLQTSFLEASCGCQDKVTAALHGTDSVNFTQIFEEGLRIPDGKHVRVANGQDHGKGIYLAAPHAGVLALDFCKESCGDAMIGASLDTWLTETVPPGEAFVWQDRQLLVCAYIDDSQPCAARTCGNYTVHRESRSLRYVGDAVLVADPARVVPLCMATVRTEWQQGQPPIAPRSLLSTHFGNFDASAPNPWRHPVRDFYTRTSPTMSPAKIPAPWRASSEARFGEKLSLPATDPQSSAKVPHVGDKGFFTAPRSIGKKASEPEKADAISSDAKKKKKKDKDGTKDKRDKKDNQGKISSESEGEEPTNVQESKVGGVRSCGMLCGPTELGWERDRLPDSHAVLLPGDADASEAFPSCEECMTACKAANPPKEEKAVAGALKTNKKTKNAALAKAGVGQSAQRAKEEPAASAEAVALFFDKAKGKRKKRKDAELKNGDVFEEVRVDQPAEAAEEKASEPAKEAKEQPAANTKAALTLLFGKKKRQGYAAEKVNADVFEEIRIDQPAKEAVEEKSPRPAMEAKEQPAANATDELKLFFGKKKGKFYEAKKNIEDVLKEFRIDQPPPEAAEEEDLSIRRKKDRKKGDEGKVGAA